MGQKRLPALNLLLARKLLLAQNLLLAQKLMPAAKSLLSLKKIRILLYILPIESYAHLETMHSAAPRTFLLHFLPK